MTEILNNRANHLIDPALHIWGWEIAAYLFLGGIAAGVLVLGTLLGRRLKGGDAPRWVRWLPFAVPVLLSVGMLFLLLDLEVKQHAYRFYLAFKPTSPMSWGAWILIVVYPASILLGLGWLSDREAERLLSWRALRLTGLTRLGGWLRAWAQPRLASIATLNVVLGIALGIYTGVLLGTLQARPLWSSAVLGPLFLASGLSTGAAFLMLFPVGRTAGRILRRWDVWAILAEITLLGLFFLDRGTSDASGMAHIGRFLGGDLTATFWAFVVVAGLLVPLTLEWFERHRHLKPSIAAPLLVLTGGLALRWILVFAGQAAVA